MAHDVFISHSAKNRDVAETICTALEQAGIRCWVAPRDVLPGRSFPGEITRAIQQSKVMLLVFSSHSNNSEQVLREVQLATDSHLSLIRFRIEDVSMNDDLKYFLGTPHWLDALTPPLSSHIARLEVAIKELLGHSVEVTGKDVETGQSQTVRLSPAAPIPPAPSPHPAVSPPPMPKPSTTVTSNGPLLTPPPAGGRSKPRRSSAPWILLGVLGIAAVAGTLLLILLVALQQPKSATEQVSESGTPAPKLADANSDFVSPSPGVTKVRQKSSSQASRQSSAPTPSDHSERASESNNKSAFERAGALTGKDDAVTSEQSPSKNPFDRAGSGIGRDDDTNTEPPPEDD